MILYKYLKRSSCCVLAGILIISVCGCGQSNGQGSDERSEAVSTQMTQVIPTEEDPGSTGITEVNIEDYLKAGVVMPEHYENMIFPLEALAVEYYAQDYPYYMEGENADSFWFSMAVLSSLMAEHGYTNPEYKDEYNLFSKEELDVYASALYHQYATGKMSLPDFQEDSPYAYYEEETQKYGLLVGNIGDLKISVSECKAVEEGYELHIELINLESDHVVMEFQSTIRPNEDAGKDSLFSASVCAFSELNEVEIDESSEMEQQENTVEESEESLDQNLNIDQENTQIESEEELESGEENEEEFLQDHLIISRSEALTLANSYLGEGVSCTYKQMISIGDCKYYDFELEGKDLTYTDVLVSITGMDVFRGVHNSDGSWTFDS